VGEGFLSLLPEHLLNESSHLDHSRLDELLLPVVVGAGGLGPVIAKAFELEVRVDVLVVFQRWYLRERFTVLEQRDSLLDEEPLTDKVFARESVAALELKGLHQQFLAELVRDDAIVGKDLKGVVEKAGKDVAKDHKVHVFRRHNLEVRALLEEERSFLNVHELAMQQAGRAHLTGARVGHEDRGGVVETKSNKAVLEQLDVAVGLDVAVALEVIEGLAVRHDVKRSQGVVLINIYI